MTLLYASPRFLDHQTGTHPERPERLVQVVRHLERTGLRERCARPSWVPAERTLIEQVHQPQYLDELAAFAAGGGGRIEADTIVSKASYGVAQLAAGAAADAVLRVLAGEQTNALCLIRPPGHHAVASGAMGFCLLNNAAIAARAALQAGLSRVLIVDWDVHHGNGTQDQFYDDPRVGYFSLHRWPFYPGTGNGNETGTGDGLGATKNLPVTYGTPREEILGRFTTALSDFADNIRPELILISAGFDAHRDDPIGSLDLETEDFATLTRVVKQVARTWSRGRIVSLLEGGYNTGVLAGCVERHLTELLTEDMD